MSQGMSTINRARRESEHEGDAALHVGDRVTLRGFDLAQSGMIVDCLSHDYFLIRWPDHGIPMTHHRYSLKRATADGSDRHAGVG
jgi:hypothetical protein